jgi:hypothetical protein
MSEKAFHAGQKRFFIGRGDSMTGQRNKRPRLL